MVISIVLWLFSFTSIKNKIDDAKFATSSHLYEKKKEAKRN